MVAFTVARTGTAQEARPGSKPQSPRPRRSRDSWIAVNEYVALQKKVDDGLPKLSGNDDPSKIEAHQAAMAAQNQAGPSPAKRGDIFGPAEPA